MDVGDGDSGAPGPFRPKFLVTTWTHGGLNLRAYFTEHGDPQWLFERVHKHLKAKCEGGAYLRKNLEGLQDTLREFGVPPGDLSYKGVGHQHTELEPWSDHTLTSRALLTFLFYQVKNRRLSCDDKGAAMSFLNKLVASIIESAVTRPPPVGLCVLDGEGVLHRVEVSFTAQGVTNDWCNLAGLSPAAKDLWSKLQNQPWCNLRLTSSFDSSTLQDVLFFLCYLVAHPKEALSKCNLFEDVCKPVLPDLLLWLGKTMDDTAKHLASQPLQDLPLLMTKGGRHKRKADQVNKFILLEKLKHHKNCRKRVASTHTSLTAKHGDLVEREAHMTVVLYNEKVAKAFANGPRQFSTSWDPSTYGGKNTLVSTLYPPATDTVAYMPNQQLRRMLLSDLQDSFIEEAKASKLGTLEGYSELRCLSHALLGVAGCSIMDFRTPAELLARPLQQGEVRIFWNGAWYIAGPGDELPRPEIPASLVLKDLPSLCSISDQGPSNTASLNFLMFGGERLMLQVQYDWFHRGWNDVKMSAKKSLGYPWKCILQLVLLFNINYSPFGSSAFFYKKQDVLEDFLSTRTRSDPAFQSFITDICRERRQREPESPEEEEQLFRSLAYMSNFQKKGGLVKLMRWMSFFEVAMDWRGDMWGTKLILQSDQHRREEDGPGELPRQLQQQQPEQQEANAAQDKADAQKELNELKKVQGVWKLAPKMITHKNIATLDMLLTVTKATWKLHAERARNVVNPQQVLEHNVASSMKMFWAYELEEMVAHSLWDKQEVRHMYPDTQDNDQLLAQHCDYFHNLLCTRATSLAAAYTLPPMRWNGVLSPCIFEAESMRDNLLEEWQLLLKLEAASLHTKNRVDCLEKMFWRLGTFTRVLCMAHEQDKLKGLPCKDGDAFPHQLLIAKTLGDSRVVEVAHQQGPDLQRGSRNNTVPNVSIMFGTIKSGALELRKVKNTVQVESQEIIYSNRNLRKVKVASSMNPRVHKLDEGLQRMMRKRHGDNWWPSPAPGSLFSSLAATEWCWSYMQDNHIGASVDDSWVSCFAGRPGDLLAHQPSGSLLKIVGAAEYGVLTWQMDVSSNTTYFMRPNRMLLQWWHIVEMNDWVHVPAKPFVSDVGAIEWVLAGPPMPLVVALAKNALFVNVGQLRRLLKSLGITIPAGTSSKAGMHQLLVAHPKEALSKCNLFEDVCKPVLPDLLLWLGKTMDDTAKHLASQPLQDLPLLMTKGGRHKRKADQVNKFILLEKLKHHKNCRKRVASTHTSLTAKHGDLVEREAHMTVVLYNEKVAKAFANGPRQFSTSWDPSTYGGKNTLVSTLYPPATDTVAYMPNQQLRRMLLSDLQDSFIEEAKASKLGTLEGYSELRCLSHALLGVAGCSIMDFRTPAELLARPLQQGEVRIFWNGAWYIAGPGDELPRPEIPASLVLKDLPSLCSISDQGPSNTASLNFLMFGGERLMLQVQYDWFHRGWNDVKMSAKKSLGYPWKCILQLVLLFNINYSPFGSSAFFYKKQDVLEDFLSTRTRSDPAFQSFITDICRERRQREPESPEEEEQLFRSLAYMSNFQKKGGLVKLMRWMSFFEVAMDWRGDMWGTKLILQSDQHRREEDGPGELPRQLQQQQPEQQEANAAQDKADAQKELNELKKVQGVWKLAPKMITHKNIATLDMLLTVTKATWKLHAERARNVVNPQQVLEHNVASSMKMFWAYELEEMVAHSLWDKQEVRHMYPDTQDNDQLLAQHCDYFHNLLCTRATSLAAAYTLPPMRWNGVLSPCIFEAESMRDNLLEEWQLLLKLEAASLHTKNRVDCLEKMFWRLGTFTRVLCMAHEQDKLKGLPCKDGDAFPHQLLIAKTLGDSRVVEVAHQQGPDLQRGSRNNTVPNVSIMFGTIKSGALELRKVKNTVQVESQEIIYSNRNLRKVKVASSMNPRVHKLDEGLQRMMRKRHGDNWWPSPAPGSLFSSLAATEWCWSYMQDNHIGASVDDSWVSCFAGRPGDLLAHQPSGSLLKIVGAAEYGVLTWQMDVSSNTTYFMRPNRMLLQWWHIVEMNDWVHVPAKPFVSDVGAIEWVLAGPPMPLVVALAKNALFVNVGQLRRLLKSLGITIPAGTSSKAGMHQLLVESVLGDPEERKHAMSSFEQASKEEPLDSDLEDVVSCLDEEDANNLDLKEPKEKKKKKRYQKKAADQQVPDRNRKGKGKGRGKGRGRGRGRKGRGKGKMAPGDAKHQCQAGPDSAQEAAAPSQLPGAAEEGASLPHPPQEATASSQLAGAAEEGEGASLPHPPQEASASSQLAGAAEEGEGASLPHPPQEASASSQLPGAAEEGEGASLLQPPEEATSSSQLLGAAEEGEGAPLPHPPEEATSCSQPPGPAEEGEGAPLPHPPQEAAASTQQEAASPVLSPSNGAEAADVAEDASQLPAPSREPRAEPIKRPKIYKTPQEVFVQMLPPGARMVLNHNDHRFMTSWVGPERGMPEDLKGKHFSRRWISLDFHIFSSILSLKTLAFTMKIPWDVHEFCPKISPKWESGSTPGRLPFFSTK